MQVLTDLKHRGVQDILIACVDGLTGFPDAIEAAFPRRDRPNMPGAPGPLIASSCPTRTARPSPPTCARSTPPSTPSTPATSSGLAGEVGRALPDDQRQLAGALGADHPFLAYGPEVRRVIYTTNSRSLAPPDRKIIKTRGHFPTGDAARRLIYLAITKAETRWKRVFHWQTALAEFKIQFGDRIPDTAI